MVQSDKGIWLHCAERRLQGRIRPHFRRRTGGTDDSQRRAKGRIRTRARPERKILGGKPGRPRLTPATPAQHIPSKAEWCPRLKARGGSRIFLRLQRYDDAHGVFRSPKCLLGVICGRRGQTALMSALGHKQT